jgi:hypothetical protein
VAKNKAATAKAKQVTASATNNKKHSSKNAVKSQESSLSSLLASKRQHAALQVETLHPGAVLSHGTF